MALRTAPADVVVLVDDAGDAGVGLILGALFLPRFLVDAVIGLNDRHASGKCTSRACWFSL